jgi:hypothetical protein
MFQTYNFVVALVVKIGVSKGVSWNRRPRPLKLISDPDLANTNEDPIKFLSLRNTVLTPTMNQDGKPWRGAKEKSDTFFQILIEACSSPGSIVADLTASTGASLKACCASGRQFVGFENDFDIYHALLKHYKSEQPEEGVVKKRSSRPRMHGTT